MSSFADDDDVEMAGSTGTRKMEAVIATYGYPAIRLALALGVVWFASGASK
jgi:hypothetical protein